MIGNAVWDTYGVKEPSIGIANSSWAPIAYLEEKGISEQHTGKNLCVEANGSDYKQCNDSVERTILWTGLVGLMSVSDMTYADGWLYNQSGSSLYPWSISPIADSERADMVWIAFDGFAGNYTARSQYEVFASVYLNSDIQIIGGDGDSVPYKLK